MIRKYYSLLLMLSLLALAGCHSHSAPQTYTTSILSDYTVDGQIEKTSTNSYVITQGMTPTVQSVLAGVDPVTFSEFRAFLDFPLGGTNGVPVDAIIDSATLDIYINNMDSDASPKIVPIRLELVDFDPTVYLSVADYDQYSNPLVYITIQPPISTADIGTKITLDVTTLMEAVQARGLPDFQVRIMEDFGTSISGFIEVDDSIGSGSASYAPRLTVTYH